MVRKVSRRVCLFIQHSAVGLLYLVGKRAGVGKAHNQSYKNNPRQAGDYFARMKLVAEFLLQRFHRFRGIRRRNQKRNIHFRGCNNADIGPCTGGS